MKKFTALSCVAAFFLIGISCKKEIRQVDSPLVVEVDNAITGTPTIVQNTEQPAPPYTPDPAIYFDWEHASTMPSEPNVAKVPVPWSEDADRQYLDALRYDYKKSDGWELVYNTFLTNMTLNNRLFILYNKYRGVFRRYVYTEVPENTVVPKQTRFIHDLTVEGEASNLLAFANQNVVDMGQTSGEAILSDPYPYRKGAWYISEFELAYNKDLSTRTRLNFFTRMGTVYASAYTGSIAGKPNDLDHLSFLEYSHGTSPISSPIHFQIKTEAQLDRYQSILSTRRFTSLQQQVQLKVENENMFNALIIPDQKLANLNLEFDGTINNPSFHISYDNVSISMPGQNTDGIVGFKPEFREVPGIFYLDKKPEIKMETDVASGQVRYSLNTPSVIYRFNPAIKAYADIQSVSQEIVATAFLEDKALTEATVYHGQSIRSSEKLNIIGVRVSFDIVPKNGSKKIHMIKTFRAVIAE